MGFLFFITTVDNRDDQRKGKRERERENELIHFFFYCRRMEVPELIFKFFSFFSDCI
jgi:hypothetical protein